MFFFGDPRNAVDMFYDNLVFETVSASSAPEMLRLPVDELTEQELRNLLTWVSWAHRKAKEEGLDKEYLEVIERDFVEVMCNLALISDEYATWITGNTARYINNESKEKRLLYKRLVETALLVGSAS